MANQKRRKAQQCNGYSLGRENLLFLLWKIKLGSVDAFLDVVIHTTSQTRCDVDLEFHLATSLQLRQVDFHFSPSGVQNTDERI